MMSLTTPALLSGLALLALPLIAHLVHRHARQTLVFPSIALLVTATAHQARMSRLRRFILLLLRMLAIACVVLTFTRPVWIDDGHAASKNANDAAAVVLLFDVSASTRQQQGGVTLQERLKGAADRSLDALRPGTDVANIITVNSRPRGVFPRLTVNLPALRNELAQLKVSQERADIATAFGIAGRQLAEHVGTRRLIVFSDRQSTNWAEFLEDAGLTELLPAGTQVRFAEVEGDPPANVALHNPRHFPVRPLAGQPCQLAVQVTNFSSQVQQVPVSVELQSGAGEITTQSQTVTLSAGQQQSVNFETTVPADEILLTTFSIPGDGLEIDNRSSLAVQASARLPVVVVSDDDPNLPGTAAFYMLRALTPRGDASDPYVVKHIRSLELASTPLDRVAAVFVGYLGRLTTESAEALVQYVDNGGGVVFFCGDGPVKENLAGLEVTAQERGILPWMPTARRTLSRQDEPRRITSGRWQSRWFREFDEQSQLAVGQIHFQQAWAVDAPDPATEVLMMFSDGTPALGSRLFGKGQFVLASFSPNATSSDLGKHGAFVALMQILARSLQPVELQFANNPPGQSYDFPLRFAKEEIQGELQILNSEGKVVPSRSTTHENGIAVGLLEPETTGLYRLTDGQQTVAAVGINVDPRESDLQIVDVARLQEHLAGQGIAAEHQAAGQWESRIDYGGRPLWGGFLTVALCAIGCEMFLLGLWKR